MLKDFREGPPLRPMLNIGCLLDIMTGRYYTGKYGESILNGGLAHLTGIGGRGNTFKSTIMFFMLLRALIRHQQAYGHIYDTEMSLTMARLQELTEGVIDHGSVVDLIESARLSLTDQTEYNGTEWWDMIRTNLGKRRKEEANKLGVTPFLDRDGSLLKYLIPFITGVDSISLFTPANVEKMQDEADIGDSKRNTESLRRGSAKSQMIMELPSVTARNGIYMLLSAHMGDEFNMETHNTPQKKLWSLKSKVKFKNTPENFTFLMNNCWYCMGATILMNDTDKKPLYPRSKEDDLKGDTDLMVVSICNLRGKSGPTGLPFEIIVSQSEGVHVGLTEFNYIKTSRFGLEGNLQNYQLSLVPDVNLSRTTIRRKIDESQAIRRALEITSELAQMVNLWHDLPPGLLCTPKELYDDLKAKGYDWDVLLKTRGYWLFDNDSPKHEKHFLSTMDLLNMRQGGYTPYWYKKEELRDVSK